MSLFEECRVRPRFHFSLPLINEDVLKEGEPTCLDPLL